MTKVAVIGLGYIGLPTSIILAKNGFDVLGVDISSEVIETLKLGKAHIVEPGLEKSLSQVISSGSLQVNTAISPADIFIIAVPTPLKADNSPDLSYIESACEQIIPHLSSGNLVILESTSPIGTTEKISKLIAKSRKDLVLPHSNKEEATINVAYCPERVLPGNILNELVQNDRIIGGISELCSKRATIMYEKFIEGQCLSTDAASAEMVKLSENAFRDVNIAFANELSMIAGSQNVDVWELIRLANRHPRVNILNPGPGVGGHCIAVDPWFLVDSDKKNSNLLRTARAVNDYKPQFILNQVKNALANIAEPIVACLGLAFKANIDDLRESPSLDICRTLASDKSLKINIVEPNIDNIPDIFSENKNVALTDIKTALEHANLILLLVDHDQFHSIPQKHNLDGKVIIDTRGIWNNHRHPN
ncbi:UDP-N-acetyl-D-mannosamine dehydrogenase [Gammaproteobacteria bacterium]|nr:UDP-N-acetyl-D-mannosamine dehydrogenase [Gammaproteobacteria bacterium]